jgi:hypothetical protein
MADRFYSCIVGDQLTHQVTEGAATSGEAIELRIADTAYSNKMQVIEALNAIKHYLMTTETDPIA